MDSPPEGHHPPVDWSKWEAAGEGDGKKSHLALFPLSLPHKTLNSSNLQLQFAPHAP